MNPAWPLAYAADFVSYLLQKLSPRDLVTLELVALFGSAARGDTTPDSDVDLFLQTRNVATLQRTLPPIVADFEASTRVRDYWRPLGVRLPLSVKVGRSPTAFAAISDALAEHGKVLYAPYRATAPRPRERQRGVIFAWENIDRPSARANIQRNLFGYESHGKRYPGWVATMGGRRLTKGAIWIPLEHLVTVERLFRKNRVTCRLMRVSDEAPAQVLPPKKQRDKRARSPDDSPGRVATRDRMLEAARRFAADDTTDGLDTRRVLAAKTSSRRSARRARR